MIYVLAGGKLGMEKTCGPYRGISNDLPTAHLGAEYLLVAKPKRGKWRFKSLTKGPSSMLSIMEIASSILK